MQSRLVRLLLTVSALAVVPSVATAGPINLVQNGGFETGNFSSWTVTGPCQFVLASVASSGCSGLDVDPKPFDGHYAAYLGAAMGTGGSLSQTLGTTAGSLYNLQFDLANTSFAGLGGVTPNQLTVSFGGTTLAGGLQLTVTCSRCKARSVHRHSLRAFLKECACPVTWAWIR